MKLYVILMSVLVISISSYPSYAATSSGLHVTKSVNTVFINSTIDKEVVIPLNNNETYFYNIPNESEQSNLGYCSTTLMRIIKTNL